MAIILLNLLNGLAVSDTYAIRTNAEKLSLVARARLISKIEEWIRFLSEMDDTFYANHKIFMHILSEQA